MMMMVSSNTIGLYLGQFQLPFTPPPLFPVCGQSLLCFNPTTFFIFFHSVLCMLCNQRSCCSGLHQSGFVLKPVEADVELSSPTSKAQVPFGMLRASFRRVAWVLVAWRNVPAMCGGITQHLAKDSCDNERNVPSDVGGMF
uniref:Candidate secreted effector n=2 Tax=Meloidogyne incognita TaxID=6306 RepID=A0A914KN84_MELIC